MDTMQKTSGHNLFIDNRQRVTISDVDDVASFNEQSIVISSRSGAIVIKGENLHVLKLDLDEGRIIIEGTINSAAYTEKKDKKDRSIWGKLFK